MRQNNKYTITCPVCGREYLPSEIFVNIFGKPYDIVRDYSGKIIDYMGESLDLAESYKCDGCDKYFDVTLKPSFNVVESKRNLFDTDYVTPLHTEKPVFEED